MTLATLYGRQTQSEFVPQFLNTKYRVYNVTGHLDLGIFDVTSSTSYATLHQTTVSVSQSTRRWRWVLASASSKA